MSAKKEFPAIYARVLAHCPKFSHPPPWQGVPVPDGVCGPPTDPSQTLADLRAQHQDLELLESGVAVTGPDGALQLATALCDPNTAIIGLRKKPKQDLFDLLTEQGCIAHDELPLCAALQDGGLQEMLAGSPPVLCVACSSADVALLLSLGIPATIASGLAQLSNERLDKVCQTYRLGKYAPQASR